MNKNDELLPFYRKAMRLMEYDSKTGELTWKAEIKNGNRTKTCGSKSYRVSGKPKCIRVGVTIDNVCKSLMAHRVAWFISTNGELPDDEIDHINRNPFDNRLVNLQKVTSRKQSENRSDQSKYGIGVYWKGRSFQYQVEINRRRYRKGGFETAEEAVEARRNFLILNEGNENE